jgi:cellulose synthase operon protein C
MKNWSWTRLMAIVLFGSLLAACTGRTADESLTAAKGYLALKDLPAAVIELKNALQVQPELAEARFLLGKALLEREEPSTAAVELRKALDLNVPANQVVPLLARALLEAGEFHKVVELDNVTTLTEPEATASLKTSAALAQSALGSPERAEALVTLALRAQSDFRPALLFRSRALATRGKFDEAIKVVDDVLERAPNDAEALTLKGNFIQAQRRDTSAAAALYRRAIEAKPDYLPAHAALLTQLLDRNDIDGARTQLDALKKVRPASLQTAYYEARLQAQSGDLKSAYESTQRLLKIAPKNPLFLQLAAALELRRGESTLAQAHSATLVQMQPDQEAGRLLLVRSLLLQGKATEALVALQPLLDRAAPEPQTLMLAGRANLIAGNYKKAATLFDQASKADPADSQSRTALAITRYFSGDRAMGLSELRAIAGSDGGTTATLALIGANVNQRDFEAALKAIDQLETQQPGTPLASHLRAWVFLLRGDPDRAYSYFEKALAVDPAYYASIEGLAILDIRDGKFDQARARYGAVLKANPKDVRALAAVAQIDALAGKPKSEVASALEYAVTIKPDDPALRYRLIDYYMTNRDYKLALNAAQSAVSAIPQSVTLLELLAAVQLAAGEADQAIRSYTKLIGLNPKSAKMLVGLAEAHLAAKSYAAATDAAMRALALSPDSEAVVQVATKVDMQAGRADAALARARSLQSRKPAAPQGWVLEGDLHVALKHWPEAAAAYRIALQKRDSSIIAQRLHEVLRSGRDSAKADAFAANRLKSHPSDLMFLSYLGSAALADGDLERASGYLEQGLRIAPDDAAMLNNLAWVQATMKKPGAVLTAERANKASPNDPAYLDTLAYALAADGKLDRAIDVQKQAIAIAPSAPVLRLNLARLYVQAGNKEMARVELDALSGLDEASPLRPKVRELQSKL